MAKDKVIGLRVEPDDPLLARLDALADHLSRKADGASIARADALRVAARRGLDAYEVEIAAELASQPARAIEDAPATAKPQPRLARKEGKGPARKPKPAK